MQKAELNSASSEIAYKFMLHLKRVSCLQGGDIVDHMRTYSPTHGAEALSANARQGNLLTSAAYPEHQCQALIPKASMYTAE